MIPSCDKDILLLPVTDGGVTNPFNMPGFPNYNSKKAKHNGLDIGWSEERYCDILACQDGTVMQTRNNDSSIGNAVILQHDYADGTHRWTAYIHLKNKPEVKKGDFVRQGQKIGVRGGSPYGYYTTKKDGTKEWHYKADSTTAPRYGVHLHLYATAMSKKAYAWKEILDNVVDPFPLLYRSKAVKYGYLCSDLRALPYLEDVEKVDDLEAIKKENTALQKQVAELQTKAEKLQLVNNGLMNRMSAIRDLTNEE